MSAATKSKAALVLVIDAGRYKGCMLSRGIKGYTAYDACDRDVGLFETALAAYEAVLNAFTAQHCANHNTPSAIRVCASVRTMAHCREFNRTDDNDPHSSKIRPDRARA